MFTSKNGLKVQIASLVILNYKIFFWGGGGGGGGGQASRALSPMCGRHSLNTNGVRWPYHFLKADDGPDL